jgi:hypothetical protein
MVLFMLHFRVLTKKYFVKVVLVFKKTFTFTFIMRNKDSTIYDQMRQAKSENVTGYSSDPDKIV